MDSEPSDEEREYESSEAEPEKQSDGKEFDGPTKRPHMLTKEFKEHLSAITKDESKYLRPTLTTPNFKLSTTERHAGALYLAPPTFLWDPSVYGIKVKCPIGQHIMHKNEWRDVLVFDFGGPIYLRRRLMRCQKQGCEYNGHNYVVRDEGLEFYPFHHTDKRAFTKTLHDFNQGFSL